MTGANSKCNACLPSSAQTTPNASVAAHMQSAWKGITRCAMPETNPPHKPTLQMTKLRGHAHVAHNVNSSMADS